MGERRFSDALMAGAISGLSVDMALFPLDTMKTRLQSSDGFWRTGGFRGIYSGVSSAAAGSMPTAALFFCTYETVKNVASSSGLPSHLMPVGHMAAASAGEVMACLVRVPTEVVKQRAQATRQFTTREIFLNTLKTEGFPGFYRGFFSTVLREVPFSFLQFPMWEFFKEKWAQRTGVKHVNAWQSAAAGALAGGLAASVTTPLDVAKTRIMLAQAGSPEASGSIATALGVVYKQSGISGLFAGLVPRVMWISIGGAIFLGIYDKSLSVLSTRHSGGL